MILTDYFKLQIQSKSFDFFGKCFVYFKKLEAVIIPRLK